MAYAMYFTRVDVVALPTAVRIRVGSVLGCKYKDNRLTDTNNSSSGCGQDDGHHRWEGGREAGRKAQFLTPKTRTDEGVKDRGILLRWSHPLALKTQIRMSSAMRSAL